MGRAAALAAGFVPDKAKLIAVLWAMGLDANAVLFSVRLILGRFSSEDEAEEASEHLVRATYAHDAPSRVPIETAGRDADVELGTECEYKSRAAARRHLEGDVQERGWRRLRIPRC
jgi:hypothetical protein